MKAKKLLLALAMGALVTGAQDAGAQDMKFFRIASGGAGGTYYPMAGLIATAVSNPPGSRPCDKGGACGVADLVAIAQSSNGSVANVNAITGGTVESGFSQSDVAYWAYTGTGLFAGKPAMKDLRVLASLFPEHVHVVVRGDSKFKAVKDLRGKRLGIGLQASGAKVGAVLLLEANGLKENVDYKAEYLNSQQSIERIRDGQLDAMLTVTGYPQAAISELASTIGAQLVPLSKAERDAVISKAPFYAHGVIPAGTYEKITTNTETVTVIAQLLVSAKTDEQLVYGITKAMWNKSSRNLFDKGHAKGKSVTLETALDGVGIPLHPGAARFYKEAGMKIPATK
ncbi:MAG: TAXI family TRAP transporter solute-binding subunit [Proteobacteria bacterium]|nr:TAXI family TRAP transporter solute-binding subunit [Pseudomonadota bacterium]